MRPRRWWVGSPDVHIRLQHHGRAHVVWEPYGDSTRWWVGPADENAPDVPLDELERAIARSSRAATDRDPAASPAAAPDDNTGSLRQMRAFRWPLLDSSTPLLRWPSRLSRTSPTRGRATTSTNPKSANGSSTAHLRGLGCAQRSPGIRASLCSGALGDSPATLSSFRAAKSAQSIRLAIVQRPEGVPYSQPVPVGAGDSFPSTNMRAIDSCS